MGQLNIIVCENYAKEFEEIIKVEGYQDVRVYPFSCLCENKNAVKQLQDYLDEANHQGDDQVIFSGSYCDSVKLLKDTKVYKRVMTTYCFNHLVPEALITYIISKGGYMIGSGWLKDWPNHLAKMGFDQNLAKQYFQSSCQELVYFDAGIDASVENELIALSSYLGLPYAIIPIEIEHLSFAVRTIVSEWRLMNQFKIHQTQLLEAKSRSAEYQMGFDLLGHMSQSQQTRDVIEKIKSIFMTVLGARTCMYHSALSIEIDPLLYSECKFLLDHKEQRYISLRDDKTFLVRIDYANQVHGILEIGEFIFPEHYRHYLNFALGIAQMCGLALTNIQNIEALVDAKDAIEYKSHHDALTGLYNRSYLNNIMETISEQTHMGLFSIDMDDLKHINDSYGHADGDLQINALADILKITFRETDLVARIGGDEFIVLVFECHRALLEQLEQRLTQSIKTYNESLENPDLAISISIGVVYHESPVHDFDALMQQADSLMYAEKQAKKGGIYGQYI